MWPKFVVWQPSVCPSVVHWPSLVLECDVAVKNRLSGIPWLAFSQIMSNTKR